MSRGTNKDCQNCEQHGRYRVPATQVYRGLDGETTFACDACHADALSLLEILGRAKSFDNFGGYTYDPEQDRERLCGQMEEVVLLMSDGEWRTLADVKKSVGCRETAASARLRDIRKIWGKGAMQSERVKGGLWRYRSLVRVAA